MATVRDLLRSAERLASDSPRRDAEVLLCHCLDKTRTWLYAWPDSDVPPECERRFTELLSRRECGQPVAYLTGQREFWSLSLAVSEATLIPRPETEILVAWALELSLPGAAAVLDLGTGSGAIALAVASERPGWRVSAVDSNPEALDVARANAARLQLGRVEFLRSDWYGALGGRRFDLLLANPPYIDGTDPHLQRGDLRFEPRSALVAGEAGIADLARLVADAPAHLSPGGWFLLEHGFQQGPQVRDMLGGTGFSAIATRPDLAGLERVSGGCLRAD